MRIKIPDKQPAGFGRLAKYMTGQSRHLSPERVDWAMERNLGTTNPDVAALAMESVAERSTRCKQPAYHLIIAFDKKDAAAGKVSKEVMQTIAVRALERLGFAEHQALICAHRDTDHPHMHILANRVHPITGKALTMSFDKRRMLEFAQEQAREFGLNVPRDRARGKERDPERSPTDGEFWQSRKEGRLPDKGFKPAELKDLQKEVWDDFESAKSWDELTKRLMAKGYALQPKGQGLMITDGYKTAKLSDLGKAVRMKLLQNRFQESFEAYSLRRAKTLAEQRELEDDFPVSDKAPPDVRKQAANMRRAKERAELTKDTSPAVFNKTDADYQYWSELYGYYRHLEGRMNSRAGQQTRSGKRELRAKMIERQREKIFTDALGRVYRDPEEAKRHWERLARGQGEERAAEQIKKNPTLLGATVVDISGPRVTPRQKAVARAYGMLKERRAKWAEAKERLKDVREQIEDADRRASLAAQEYEAIKQHVGAPDVVKEILFEKAKARNRMLERLNERIIAQANVTEEQRQRMHKAWRQYNERKRDRTREREYMDVPHITRDRGRDR